MARIGGSTHSNQMDQRMIVLSTTVRAHPLRPQGFLFL